MKNQHLKQRDMMSIVQYLLIGYSLIVYGAVFSFDYHLPPDNFCKENYRTFLQKINWNLFPLYFYLAMSALRLSWTPFLACWGKLVHSKVIKAGAVANIDDLSRGVVRYVMSWRWVCVVLAIASAVIISYFDLKDDILAMYTAKHYEEQMTLACKDPDFFSKWLFKDKESVTMACKTFIPEKTAILVADEKSIVKWPIKEAPTLSACNYCE